MTTTNQWKKTEKDIAETFNTERTPFSGSTSGLTSADTLHEDIFVECKTKKKHATKTLYDETKILAEEEGKIPLVVLKETGSKEVLWVLEQKYVFQILQEIDLNKLNPELPQGTTIRKLLETTGESVKGLFELQQDIDRQMDEIVRSKKLTKESKQLLKGLAVLSYYMESIRDFQKMEEENATE